MHAPKGVYANFPRSSCSVYPLWLWLNLSKHRNTHALTHSLTHSLTHARCGVVVKSWSASFSTTTTPLRTTVSRFCRLRVLRVAHMVEGYNFSPEKLTSGKLKTFENFTLRAETLHTRAYIENREPREKVNFLWFGLLSGWGGGESWWLGLGLL